MARDFHWSVSATATKRRIYSMADINSTSATESQSRFSGTGASAPPDGNNGGDHGIVSRVCERAAAELSTQKNLAFDGIGSVAQAVRQSTQHLREQQHDALAGYVEQAADQIERFAQQLRGRDLNELFNDAQRLARRQPAIFIGSAFALGLIGARFFKSSAHNHYENYAGSTYRQGRTDVPGRTDGGSSSYASRSATQPLDSPAASPVGRQSARDESTASPNRITTNTTGEPFGMGPSASPPSGTISGASASTGRSGQVSSSKRG